MGAITTDRQEKFLALGDGAGHRAWLVRLSDSHATPIVGWAVYEVTEQGKTFQEVRPILAHTQENPRIGDGAIDPDCRFVFEHAEPPSMK